VQPGVRLAGRYQIVRPLGEGGMGRVYLSRDIELDRDVAIKVLPPDLLADRVARERLRREARSAAGLDHPFVCKVFDVGDEDGQLFIVMEFVTGETLHDLISKGPLPVEQAIEIAGEIAEALDAAHDLRLVHRDLKPANVMTTTRGHVKVMDFGLAKTMGSDAGAETQLEDKPAAQLTDRGSRVGTPAYMSPEQIAGDAVDHRSDIFSFGVLLAEILTGVHPFSRTTVAGTIAAVLSDPPVVGHAKAPEVPSALRAVIHRMLQKLPHERYQSMRDVRKDLDGLRGSRSTSGGLLSGTSPVGHRGRPQRWPMVGRDNERAELMSRLEDALAGRGSLVLIGGEPGIGKTRLTEELLAEARRRGAFCLVGHCYEGEGAPPYVPFVEITEHTARVVPPSALRGVLGDSAPEIAKLMPALRQMFPDIPPALTLPAEQQRRFFFNAYRDFVERSCRANPIAVVFEDLHWADEPTLQLVLHIAQSMSSLPLLIVGTYRDVELEVTRPFAKILETLLRQRLATRMTLRRLPAEGVAELLTAMSGKPAPQSLARVIFRETEGNPFFVEEVFQHLSEEGKLFDPSGSWRQDLRVESLEVPEGVRLVIGRRLERLSEATRKILTTAAVIGRAFTLTLLEAVEVGQTGGGDVVLDAVEAAEQAHLLSPQPGARESRYVFAHELIRQTLIESLSLPRRQRLHGRVAAAIERLYANALDSHVSALAHHLYQAGAASDPEKTIDCLIRAADQARANAAHEEALACLDNALSLWEGPPTARIAEVYERRAFTLRSLGHPDAIEGMARAARTWHEIGEDDRAALVSGELGNTRLWMIDNDTARLELDAALAGYSKMSDSSRAMLHYYRAISNWSAGRTDDAAIDIDKGDALRVPGAVPLLDYAAASTKANFYWAQLHAEESIAFAREAAAGFASLGDVWRETEISWTISMNLGFLGRIVEARASFREFEEKATRIGHQGARWVITHHRALIEAARGDTAASDRSAREAQEIGRRFGIPWVYHTDAYLANVAIWQGRDAEGLAELRRVAQVERSNNYWYPATRAQLFDALAALAPDEALAWHHREPFAARPQRTRETSGFWTTSMLLVQAYARLGLTEEVVNLAPTVEEILSRKLVFCGSWILPNGTIAGILDWHRGRWDDAEANFLLAIEQMDSYPMEYFRGQPREWFAKMLIARGGAGDEARARQLRDEAREIYLKLGYLGLAKRLGT
jgi:tetratricopeptide (TPR) repeat protein